MTYSQKVKQSKIVLEAIRSLKDDEHIIVSYGKNFAGEPKEYKIKAYKAYNDKMSYSIWKHDGFGMDGMNIDSLTNTQAKAYTYDMMSQRTTYNFPLYLMKIVKEEVA